MCQTPINAKSVNFLEENTSVNPYDYGLSSSFFSVTPQATKGKKR